MWKVWVFPLLGWPTRREFAAAYGHDPSKLAQVSAAMWQLFRATAIGCGAAWLLFVAVLAGVAGAEGLPADGWQLVGRMSLLLAVFFGVALLVNYPWPFRDQGSRWVRWLVLGVGVPSTAAFVVLVVS